MVVNPRGYEEVTPLYVDIDPEIYKLALAVIEAAKRYCKTGLGSDQLRLAESIDALLAAKGEESDGCSGNAGVAGGNAGGASK